MYLSRRMLVPEHRDAEEVLQLADAIGAEKLEDLHHSPENGITREITWRILPGLLLHYAYDLRSLTSFVVISGDSSRQVSHYAGRVAEFLESPPFDDLLRLAEQGNRDNRPAYIGAILRAGIGAPAEPDFRLIHFLWNVIRDPDIGIRSAALMSMRYAFWREFQPLLKQMSETEADETLREEARVMLETSINDYGVWWEGNE